MAKKAVEMKKPEVQKIKQNLQYNFTRDEMLGLGKELAQAQESLHQLDSDRRSVVDEWKAKISAKDAEITSLSNYVTRGYCYRDIECEVTLDEPAGMGKKTCRRVDTGEIVWVKDMTDDDRQLVFPATEEKPAETESAENPETDNPEIPQ